MDLLRAGIRFQRQQTLSDDREMLFRLGDKELEDLSGNLAIVRQIGDISSRDARSRMTYGCFVRKSFWLRDRALNLGTRNPVTIGGQYLLFAFDRRCLRRFVLDRLLLL